MASIIIPAMGTARKDSKFDYCQNNLQHINTALLQYAKNHEGLLPTADNWPAALLPDYLDILHLHCLSVTSNSASPSYSLNTQIAGRKLKDLPSDTVLVFESKSNPDHPHSQSDYLDPRHQQGANILFANGQIKAVDNANLLNLRWN